MVVPFQPLDPPMRDSDPMSFADDDYKDIYHYGPLSYRQQQPKKK